MRVARLRIALALFAALAAEPAFAACEDSAWNTTAIMAHLAAAIPPVADQPLDRASGPGLAISLSPVADVAFEAQPERPPRNPDPRGAVLHFGAGAAGTYQIALSQRAWIDIIQDGKYLAPIAFVDFRDCPDLHKIVAFDIGAGPFTLQLSDATTRSIAAAIAPRP